jgi:redox-sensing transcriptional repressor
MEPDEITSLKIPVSVVRRLPRYLTQAQHLRQEGVEWVSSLSLAETLGLTSSTVRQDLSHIDFQGVSKRGYSTAGLEAALARTLGVDRDITCVLVGAGNLGRALALHDEFGRQGFKIVGVFDSAPAVVGKKVGRFTVQGMTDLAVVVREQKVEIGIISVPHEAAQPVADQLIAVGVRGLLNLTTAHLLVPVEASVVDARVLASLRELAYGVKRR